MSRQSPRGPGEARRNLPVLSLRALLAGLRATVLTVILQPFVLSLGASVALLGLLETVGGYRGLIPTLVQPAAGWLADRVGRKGVAVVAGVAAVGSLALFAFAGAVKRELLLWPAVVLLGLSAVARPALDALTGESAGAERVGFAYGLVTFGWAVAGVVASLGAGFLAERLGFAAVFALTIVVELFGTLLLAFGVRETLAERRRARLAQDEVRRLTVGVLAPPRALRGFYLAVVTDAFFSGFGVTLLYGFFSDRYGFSPVQFGVMTTAYSAAWALMQLPAGHWVDQGKPKELLVISEVLYAGAALIWLVSARFEVLVGSMALVGVVSALWSPALYGWLYARVPMRRRAEEMGRLNALTGLFAFPAPWIGGILYERFGFAVPISITLGGILLAAAIFVRGLPDATPG